MKVHEHPSLFCALTVSKTTTHAKFLLKAQKFTLILFMVIPDEADELY